MKTILIGIGGIDATNELESSVKTLALGSCVSVVILDPVTHCVGMAHVALPESTTDLERAKILPGYFADTAIPVLLQKMAKFGSNISGKDFIVKLVGGANVMDPSNKFNIGKRNVLAIKKTLWALGMGVLAEDVGGDISRTVEVFVSNGHIKISSPNKESWEI